MDKFNTILTTVCEACGVRVSEVMSKSRKRDIVDARHITMYFLNERLKEKLTVVGDYFQRNHTVVLHARNNVARLLMGDNTFRKKYLKCLSSLDLGLFLSSSAYENTPQY